MMAYIGVLVAILIIFIVSMLLLLMIIKPNIYEKELEDVEMKKKAYNPISLS